MAHDVSPRLLAQAPHRLMFFVGATNVLLAMAWWAAWLWSSRWPALGMPQPRPYAGWLHAIVMQYQMLASFVFGFLLTVFPRWMGLPELPRRVYVPVGLGLFGGQIATLLGALGVGAGIVVGSMTTLAGWLAGTIALASLLRRDPGAAWHARSCFAALTLGLCGLIAWIAFLLGAPPFWAVAAIKLGGFGFLLPMYATVAHRMFPFFAASVVPGYRLWRPFWPLAAIWAMASTHLGLELAGLNAWRWPTDMALCALATTLCVRWWPHGPKPGLLTVLFIGLAWLPIAFALYAAQGAALAFAGLHALGRAPAHALFVGFFGSVLVAMVTRVTQGHSGRPLTMPAAAWFAFAAIQLVTLLRIAAEFARDSWFWQAVAAIGWLIALSPWVARIGRIYLSPRADGKPG